jgi:alkylation response protein AidB-like acyl-CoA dehydrogenase
MKDTFIPEYRVVEAPKMIEGAFAADRQPGKTLYALSFGCTFASAITSATLGIARGALDAYREYMQKRVSAAGVVAKVDPFQQAALAEAEADWSAAVLVIDAWTERWWAQVERGEPITTAQRLEFRRDQVRAVQRVLESVDRVYSLAGSASVWTDKPLERYWRDLRTGGSHICNIYDTAYTSWGNYEFNTGGPVNTMH